MIYLRKPFAVRLLVDTLNMRHRSKVLSEIKRLLLIIDVLWLNTMSGDEAESILNTLESSFGSRYLPHGFALRVLKSERLSKVANFALGKMIGDHYGKNKSIQRLRIDPLTIVNHVVGDVKDFLDKPLSDPNLLHLTATLMAGFYDSASFSLLPAKIDEKTFQYPLLVGSLIAAGAPVNSKKLKQLYDNLKNDSNNALAENAEEFIFNAVEQRVTRGFKPVSVPKIVAEWATTKKFDKSLRKSSRKSSVL